MRKFIFTCLVVSFVTQVGYAQSFGTTTVPFLRISPTARASGMGEAFVAISDDIGALYTNPAGLPQIQNREVLATYVLWIEEMKNHYVGFVYPFKGFALGTSVTLFTMNDIEITDDYGTVSPNKNQVYDIAGTLSFGHQLIRNFMFWGITLKGIYQKLGPNTGVGFATDFGLIMKINILSLGVVVQNVGSGISFGKVTNSLPLEIKSGIALKLLKDKLVLSTDFCKPQDDNLKVRVGSEFNLTKSLALRAGYQGMGEISKFAGFTIGLGFRTPIGGKPASAGVEMYAAPTTEKKAEVEVDYALLTSGDFGFVHRVSAILRF